MSVKLPAQALDTAVGAIRNWQLMHSNAALPLKLLFVCRGGKKRSVGLGNLSAQTASFKKDSSLLPERGAHANFAFTPTRQVKGHVGLGSLWES